MSDNPFDEDSDRTIIRPTPGGRPNRVAAEPATAPAADRAQDANPMPRARAAMPGGDDGAPIVLGINPLVSAAAPLMALIGRLARTYSSPNVDDLRERTLRQIRSFESAALQADVPREVVVKARYALCASLDDVAQNTEWGRDGNWAARPLVTSFREGLRGYEGIQSGVGFFRLLEDAKRNPGKELPLLELMYLCLSLGFLGELRIRPRPQMALDQIREDLYTIISRHRAVGDATLSPHWQGVDARYTPPRMQVPGWVIGAGSLFVIGAVFVWFSASLNAASDRTFARMLAAPLPDVPAIERSAPVHPPPPPPAPLVPKPEPLSVFLKPEIDRGLVSVLGDHAMPIVRIRNRGLFASGSATVASSYVHLLERIGEALKTEKGPVQVIGYTDNQPIHTVRFPSNYELSKARADAAAAIIGRALGEPGRITVEGRGDADPIASNKTPAGRDENRRIEVVLHRQG